MTYEVRSRTVEIYFKSSIKPVELQGVILALQIFTPILFIQVFLTCNKLFKMLNC